MESTRTPHNSDDRPDADACLVIATADLPAVNHSNEQARRSKRLLSLPRFDAAGEEDPMQTESRLYSLPRWRATRWLSDAGPSVHADIRVALIGGLYGSWPVFAAGAINTVAVSAAIAFRQPTTPFIAWFVAELAICLARLTVLVSANRAAVAHRETPTDLHLLLAVAWSASVGLGVLFSLAYGDWVISTLACLSAAAMVGGICFRNFSAPRLAATMILLSLGPIIPGVAFAGEPLLYIVYLQVPLYLAAMTAAAFRLNKMLVTVMHSERESDYLARHDALTGLWNRAGFVDALKARLADNHGGESFALLFLDLDDFKPINDTFGHPAGDKLLVMVAESLCRTLPATDVIARMGGDEFLVLANDVTAEQALAIGHRIIGAVTMPYALGEGNCVSVGVSVGIAMSPEHGAKAEALLMIADAALYEAKSSGKSCCRMAGPEANLAALRKITNRNAAEVAGFGVAA
jgi:diguanylate cyclase (GGDEF)-like protein